ncbi:flavin reductase family protein [bacterium D16-51]|nr:flavin reductase family protein [bacterium D16-59]RKI57614.1 flavin reductase family protein [bacterium D16-51]
MRKDLGKKLAFLPLPVLMIGTYDADGRANVMNAAWGGVHDSEEVFISLGKHKTTDNLALKKAFTVGFATKETAKISDYFGVASGNNEDKIAKAGVHVVKSNHVDAPIIEEYPLTLECTVKSFSNGELIGEIVNVSVDEKYIDENGTIDVGKMNIIAFDMFNNHYRVLGEIVGNAFKDGLELKNS